MVAKERSVWLNIIDIPLYAWREDFFKTIVFLVGKYANMDDNTWKKSRLDVGRVFATVTSPEAIRLIVWLR